jgi:hypothetical protein
MEKKRKEKKRKEKEDGEQNRTGQEEEDQDRGSRIVSEDRDRQIDGPRQPAR